MTVKKRKKRRSRKPANFRPRLATAQPTNSMLQRVMPENAIVDTDDKVKMSQVILDFADPLLK